MGIGPGMMVAYDESEGYVAATEFGLRMAAYHPQATVWLDVRGHLLGLQYPHEVEIVLVRQRDWTANIVLDIAKRLMGTGLVVVDSLSAIADLDSVDGLVVALHRQAVEQRCLVLVGNYMRGDGRAVAERTLAMLCHTTVRVTHKDSLFGVSMPMSRCKVPLHDWLWDTAWLNVGQ